MASVNIENARSAASAINKKTERLDDLYRNFDKLISAVQTGWNGTGSEDYVYRLQILKNGLADIVRNTSDIAAILNKAANDAEEFDRKASEIFGGSSNPYGYTSDRWHINADGSYHINFDCGIMCQGAQQFTHGENPWVECTSTALAQCNNINGGEFKSANDYNDGNGHTQIGFVQSNSELIKGYCEDSLKQGKAVTVYFNYGWTDEWTEPGQVINGKGAGDCVTVVGSFDPNSNRIEDLCVIDPADGKMKSFGECAQQLGGGYKNLFVACETSIQGEGTKASDVMAKIPYSCTHGISESYQSTAAPVQNNTNNHISDKLVQHPDGTLLLNYYYNDKDFRQGSQVFTHGEYAGVECTSTALSICNNINGGSYKSANDYNDWNGTTQIGFLQSDAASIKGFCEDSLNQGRATTIYFNYGWTNEWTAPGQVIDGVGAGHCVTVVGTTNPGSSNIEDLWVIDPSDGCMKSFGKCAQDLGGGYKNLFIACETSVQGAGTKASDVRGKIPIMFDHMGGY